MSYSIPCSFAFRRSFTFTCARRHFPEIRPIQSLATSEWVIAAEKDGEKLLIDFLAGQSNMQACAEVSNLI